jgi:hypothetical protein
MPLLRPESDLVIADGRVAGAMGLPPTVRRVTWSKSTRPFPNGRWENRVGVGPCTRGRSASRPRSSASDTGIDHGCGP